MPRSETARCDETNQRQYLPRRETARCAKINSTATPAGLKDRGISLKQIQSKPCRAEGHGVTFKPFNEFGRGFITGR
jgi:hypothetical protein